MKNIFCSGCAFPLYMMPRYSPGDTSRTYVGTVNQAGWKVDPSATARTWLCTAITGRSKDKGKTYEVAYEFAYRGSNLYTSNGWDAVLYYTDPTTGKPPSGTSGTNGSNGVKVAQIYVEKNFNALGLA